MKRSILLAVMFTACIISVNAKVKLPSIISDKMVLQQQTKVKLWGTSDKKGEVEITTSWNEKTYKAKISNDGKWEIVIETGNAGGPYQIKFNDGNVIELKNILLGEVWLCSGQSNMEMPIKGFLGQPVEHSSEIIANATASVPIRLFTVKRNPSKTPLDDCPGTWELNIPEHVMNFSATCLFFWITIATIAECSSWACNSSWGGSAIQSWMDSEVLKQYPEISQKHLTDDSEVKNPHSVASMLYNGMFNL